MNLEFSGRIFETYSNVKFGANPPIGSRIPCGQTVRDDEADGRLSQFCERAQLALFSQNNRVSGCTIKVA
jgi:hypothetical protein